MKILIYCNSLAVGGGIERFAATLGNELTNKGHKIFYLTFLDKEPKYDFNGTYLTFNEKKPRVEWNITHKLFDFLIKPLKIKKICKNNDIDVIIAGNDIYNCQAIFSKYLFRNKSKIIATHHGDPELLLNDKFAFNIIKFFYTKADKVICVSKAMEKIFREKYRINENIQTIFNMIDLEQSLNMAKDELPKKYYNLFKSGIIFINIGRISEQKGQIYLIRSFKKVVAKHESAKLCILGDASSSDLDLKEELINMIKELDLENNVFFIGNQTNIYPFLKNSNCFVLSSLWEGFPMILIESLTTNIPIISTDCKTGPRESLCPEITIDRTVNYPYYGDYGILCMPFERNLDLNILKDPLSKSEEIFSDLMIKVIEDDKLRKKYSNGLLRAKNFDIKEIIQEWEKIINKIC